MAIDTHIKFDGVEGESVHQDHKGEIDVKSWSWSATNPSNLTGTGSGSGKPTPGALVFTHQFDKASPVLIKKLAQGLHFKDATVTCRKSGDGQQDFLKVTLTEVYITSIAPVADPTGGVIEEVQLSYKEIGFAYKPQDEKGALGGEVKVSWNNSTMKIA